MKRPVFYTDIAKIVASNIIDTGAYVVNINKDKKEWIVHNNGVILPCYTNCRFLFPHRIVFCRIISYLESLINLNIADADILIGLSTAGIPIAARLSERMDMPMAYVRSKPKGYGVGNLVEGNPPKNKKAILLDDTIASGKSLMVATKALEDECEIVVSAIITITAMSEYGFDNKWEYFRKKGIPILSLTNYKYIQEEAIKRGLITRKQAEKLEDFYRAPRNFKWGNF